MNKELIAEICKNNGINCDFYEFKDELSLLISQKDLLNICKILRDNPETSFDYLTDITAIDWLDKKNSRYEVVYFLYSLKSHSRLRIKVPVEENNAECPSVVEIWSSANWYERETFDMYGIKFTGHPSLRRFYMPEDYVDPITKEPLFPLRKDFPLMGVPDSLPLPPYPEKYGELV
ncbi:MAG: NADH-quinone oxidoreductase subunit C [Candidatus Kapabacteria bacterium]|nr:NADH-quinone oxidoreductase subunit C [Candidatus Kapabacteria bacterium]